MRQSQGCMAELCVRGACQHLSLLPRHRKVSVCAKAPEAWHCTGGPGAPKDCGPQQQAEVRGGFGPRRPGSGSSTCGVCLGWGCHSIRARSRAEGQCFPRDCLVLLSALRTSEKPELSILPLPRGLQCSCCSCRGEFRPKANPLLRGSGTWWGRALRRA